LRAQKRRPEFRWADLSENEADVLDAVMTNENEVAANDAMAAHELVHKPLGQLNPTINPSFGCWISNRRRS
jgi:RNA polymerase sigma-70 factor (ECF subfamily)